MKALVTGVAGQLGHDVMNWQGVGMKELVPISRKSTAASRTGRQW